MHKPQHGTDPSTTLAQAAHGRGHPIAVAFPRG